MSKAKDISEIISDANFGGTLDVDGTTNLDAVDIDGAVQMGASDDDVRMTLQGNNQYRLALKNAANALVYLGSGGANNFRISNSGGATIFEINDDKDIVLPGAGAGINLGVTSATASNLLDDYEEGTWTPVIGGPSSRAGTWSSAIGRYTKVGNKVTLQVDITGSGMYFTATSGYTSITGVPFAALQGTGTQNYAGSWSGNNVGVSSGGTTYLNATTMYLHSSNSGQSSAGVSGIGVTITYFTAA